jgi:hypothetical protein
MVMRGVTRRCALCGSGGLFLSWFKMRDRCPRCSYVFAREDGFSLGAVLMNFAVTEALLALFCIARDHCYARPCMALRDVGRFSPLRSNRPVATEGCGTRVRPRAP